VNKQETTGAGEENRTLVQYKLECWFLKNYSAKNSRRAQWIRKFQDTLPKNYQVGCNPEGERQILKIKEREITWALFRTTP